MINHKKKIVIELRKLQVSYVIKTTTSNLKLETFEKKKCRHWDNVHQKSKYKTTKRQEIIQDPFKKV